MSGGLPVLAVRDLAIEVATAAGPVRVVDGVSFELGAGEVLGLVGESGSGKSLAMLAIMGLLPPAARLAGGEIRLRGCDLRAMPPAELEAARGRDLAMIFQDPMTSLNPVLTIGRQIVETLRIHNPALDAAACRARAAGLLGMVGVPDPARRLRQYPHEFSGGMRQRVMIAIAMANDPVLLIADEPTTALDVTIQAQVMRVLTAARARTGSAMLLVTHDLGLVAENAGRVAVMYGGRIAETGPVADVFARPSHPYTIGLLRSLPRLDGEVDMLFAIPGQPPGLDRPPGCIFQPRCGLAAGRAPCRESAPTLAAVAPGHASACHFAGETEAWDTAATRQTETHAGGPWC
jgi:oligopeptide/dipeptide ABC transporter ATP-binding protein